MISMHQVGGVTPRLDMGPQMGDPALGTWRPCPPGQTRMKYDGAPDNRMTPYLDANLGARKDGPGITHQMHEGAIDIIVHSMFPACAGNDKNGRPSSLRSAFRGRLRDYIWLT